MIPVQFLSRAATPEPTPITSERKRRGDFRSWPPPQRAGNARPLGFQYSAHVQRRLVLRRPRRGARVACISLFFARKFWGSVGSKTKAFRPRLHPRGCECIPSPVMWEDLAVNPILIVPALDSNPDAVVVPARPPF
ncbi:hypothetical protein EVAR_60199_1 [Eumeta japonica]|uniref:Uncharacterized protein n=1 Tax=Eumeta variegata TaxID=151549 RepID=A0A4C1ZCC1_EUMVA|nr:hypothetical protein EVAR_60199_1 [Eumeta japonica]